MESRREFFKSVTALGVAGVVGLPALQSDAQTLLVVGNQKDDHGYWLGVMDRIATPVLENLSRRTLKKAMPVEAANPIDRARYAHLEAFGRLLAGIAPWLGVQGLSESETEQQKRITTLVHASLDAATDSKSPDFMNFFRGGQPLVDTAFMAQGILRAPSALWQPVAPQVRRQIIEIILVVMEIYPAMPDNILSVED